MTMTPKSMRTQAVCLKVSVTARLFCSSVSSSGSCALSTPTPGSVESNWTDAPLLSGVTTSCVATGGSSSLEVEYDAGSCTVSRSEHQSLVGSLEPPLSKSWKTKPNSESATCSPLLASSQQSCISAFSCPARRLICPNLPLIIVTSVLYAL